LSAIRLFMDDAGSEEGFHRERACRRVLRIELRLFCAKWLFRSGGRTQAAASYMEPGGRRAILHPFPAVSFVSFQISATLDPSRLRRFVLFKLASRPPGR